MCYNFDTSINVWLATFILSMLILTKCSSNSMWIILFILTYSQIQILEAIIWRNMNDTQLPTKILAYMLLLQPLLNSFFGWSITHNNILLFMTIVYVYIILEYYYYYHNNKYQSIKDKNGHLEWIMTNDRNESTHVLNGYKWIYLCGIIIPFFFMQGGEKYLPIIFAIITYLYSYLNIHSQTTGASAWCYRATYLIIFVSIYEFVKQANLFDNKMFIKI